MCLQHLRFYFIYSWNYEKADKQQDGMKSKNRMNNQKLFLITAVTVAFSVNLKLETDFTHQPLLTYTNKCSIIIALKQYKGGAGMYTALGQGENRVDGFSVDFCGKQIYLAGKAYLKGAFANEVLNISEDDMMDLLLYIAPGFNARRELLEGKFDSDLFKQIEYSFCKIKKLLRKRMPFSLLDWELEELRVDTALSEKIRVAVSAFFEAQRKGEPQDDICTFLHEFFMHVLDFYVHAPMDLSNFQKAIRGLERFLRDLDVRDEHHFAMATQYFFASPTTTPFLRTSQITDTISGFTLSPDVKQEYVILSDTDRPDELKIGRRMHFERLMDFLVMDFFEGLQVGHAPKKCAVCGRYFLTTNARPRKYCDGHAPDDPRGRSCQQVGARKQRSERERADDHPVKMICEKRCNTIDHHLRQGKIDKEFAKKAKTLARNKRDKALRNNRYYISEYENEMTQEAIYTQTQHLLGRPPTIRSDNG